MNKIFKKFNVAIAVMLCVVLVSACSIVNQPPSPDPQPYLITPDQREQNPIRPFDSFEESVDIATGTAIDPTANADAKKSALDEELTRMAATLQSGKKPNFEGTHLSVKMVFDAATSILNSIILNNMSDYDRVLAIHDYITFYTDYNTGLYEQYLTDPQGVDPFDPSFDVRGVFLNTNAVCQGLAEAFVLMCGMEGIRAITVTGSVYSGGSSIAHAWNRVFIDNEWYNVDTTLDMLNIQYPSGDVKKYLSRAYFLVDTQSMTEHTINNIVDINLDGNLSNVSSAIMSNYDADNYYGFFEKHKLAEINGTQYYYSASNQSELNEIFKYIKRNNFNIGKIEIRAPFVNTEEQFTLAFNAAYAFVLNANYLYTATRQGINNTFYCFIYT